MNRTILLVEDEADTRDILSRALERAHFTCLTADGVQSALDAATAAAFIDVVVTDVVMAGDDRAGLRLLHALGEAGVHAPVIVITAFADVEKVKIALNEGAAYFLEKPFRAPDLIDAIERACQRRDLTTHSVDEVLSRARLTDKEHAVALRLLQGLSSGEIAALEHNSEKTIRQHQTQIYAKCGVSSRAELFKKVYVR
ncbi:MAG TPA: response regulator [Polyangia bacterium]|jgi:FixJ family two-component response regulator|nr:response regulator [Polyangia bacterium]